MSEFHFLAGLAAACTLLFIGITGSILAWDRVLRAKYGDKIEAMWEGPDEHR